MIPFFYLLFELYLRPVLQNMGVHTIFRKKGKKCLKREKKKKKKKERKEERKFGNNVQNLFVRSYRTQ